jgi:quercetin dioxygenase-like cupin family protein
MNLGAKSKDLKERNMKAVAKQPVRSDAIRPPGPLGSPMLAFDLNAEIERLRNEDAWQGGRNSKTLVKHSDFRIALTVLQSKAHLHEHMAVGRISVQVVAGHIRMHMAGKIFDLPAGHLIALDRAIPHDVQVLEDSAFLLTICWPEGVEKS